MFLFTGRDPVTTGCDHCPDGTLCDISTGACISGIYRSKNGTFSTRTVGNVKICTVHILCYLIYCNFPVEHIRGVTKYR